MLRYWAVIIYFKVICKHYNIYNAFNKNEIRNININNNNNDFNDDSNKLLSINKIDQNVFKVLSLLKLFYETGTMWKDTLTFPPFLTFPIGFISSHFSIAWLTGISLIDNL